MRNILTIMRRDLGTYFTSPIGYIFMIVFVAISVGLYITTFFAFPVADMRPYFGNLPLLLCVFIPAVTMRVWAEERKENTWEMLLTFPMKAWELVAGKFLASLAFFAVTLAATLTVPAMLFYLGDPDNGAVFAGYFGTLLLGAYFLSIGIFFSGFYKDQIIAFVITLLVCFGIFLVGTNFIATFIDGNIPGLGSLLMELVGLSNHYESFTRGVVELADILYFVAWTAVFLLLNVLFIDIRSRPNARLYFSATVAVCVVIGLLGNWLVSDTSLIRFDATEDKIYTMSEASKRILSELDTPVQVKYYVTPKSEMPTGLTTIEADVTSKLQELGIAANGNIQFQPVHLSAANVIGAEPDSPDKEKEEGDEESVIEKRMLEKGVQPFSVQAMSEDQISNKLVYSTLGVGYKDKQEELIAPVMPENLDELEYRIVSTVYKLTREKKPVVALFAPTEAVNIDPQMKQMLMQMGQEIPTSEDPYKMVQRVLDSEKYEVQRVHLTAESPMPEEYDTLVVINPRGMNERQRWELNRAIVSGKPVIMAVQTYEWDYTPNNRGSVSISRREENPSVNELLASYGVQVSKEVLMDENHIALTVSSGSLMDQLTGRGMTLPLPMHIMVNSDQMDQETSITGRLSSVFYLWGTALQIDQDTLKDTKLNVRPLLYSTANSWTIGDTSSLTQASFVKPDTGLQKFPLMAMVTGQFPNAYDSVERPAWPQEQPQPGQPPRPPVPEDGPAPTITPAPGKLILIGCSEMFRDNFIQQAGNMDLIMNSIDAITLGDDIVNVRSRKPIDRAIGKPTNSQRTFWKTMNYGFSPTLIAVAGVMVMTLRRRSRNAYTLAQQSAGA